MRKRVELGRSRRLVPALLVTLACCHSETPKAPPIRILDARAALPPSLKMKGKVLDVVRFKDAGGEYLLAVSLFRQGTPGEDLVSEVHAQQWRKQGSAYEKVWQLRDFSSNPLEWVEYSPSQFKLVDADQDGRADTQVWYTKACDGLDPDTLKLMLYLKGKKLAIRGLIPKHADDLGRYEKNPDPALAKAPRQVRDYLSEEWEALVKGGLDSLWKEAEE